MNATQTSPGSVGDADIVASWDAIAMGFAHMHRRLLAAIEAEGLPGPSFEALRLLLASDDHRMPMSRLARDLTMTAGGLTKLADRLARDGLIDRRNSSDDRRVVYAALTDKGAELATRTLEIYRAGPARARPGRPVARPADRAGRRHAHARRRHDGRRDRRCRAHRAAATARDPPCRTAGRGRDEPDQLASGSQRLPPLLPARSRPPCPIAPLVVAALHGTYFRKACS